MPKYRTPAAYALTVLVVLAAIVLTTPNGATHARWSAAGRAEVPALAMGRIGFEITGAGNSATLTNASGFGIEYRPVRVFLADSAGASVTPPAGMGLAYRTGAACNAPQAPAQWTAVAPGGSAPMAVGGESRAPLERDRPAELCLTVSTDGVAEAALRPLAGRSLQVVTELEAASFGGGAWSAIRSWSAPFTVDVPDTPDPLQLRCTPVAGSTKSVRLSWSGGPLQIGSWDIYAQRHGASTAPTRVTAKDAGARTLDLTRELLTEKAGQVNGTYRVWVEPSPSGTSSAGARAAQVEVDLQGVNVVCAGGDR